MTSDPEQQSNTPEHSPGRRRGLGRFFVRYDPELDIRHIPIEQLSQNDIYRDELARLIDDRIGPRPTPYPVFVPRGEDVPKFWSDEKLVGNYRAAFDTKFRYKHVDDGNILEKVKIRIRHQSEPERKHWDFLDFQDLNIKIDLAYAQGRLSSLVYRRLTLRQDGATHKQFESMFLAPDSPNAFGKFLNGIANPDRALEEYNVTINIANPRDPSLVLDPVFGQGERREYIYSPELDPGHLLLADSVDDEGLSIATFCNIVDGALSVIPSSEI